MSNADIACHVFFECKTARCTSTDYNMRELCSFVKSLLTFAANENYSCFTSKTPCVRCKLLMPFLFSARLLSARRLEMLAHEERDA